MIQQGKTFQISRNYSLLTSVSAKKFAGSKYDSISRMISVCYFMGILWVGVYETNKNSSAIEHHLFNVGIKVR